MRMVKFRFLFQPETILLIEQTWFSTFCYRRLLCGLHILIPKGAVEALLTIDRLRCGIAISLSC